jgi:zinc transport system permease protein
MSFWESSFMWLEAVVASVAVAAACAFVGVYMVLRRVVFLPAAISQVAGLGVALAFLVTALFPSLAGVWLLEPVVMATAISLAAALVLGWAREPRRLSRESLIGIAFILASALVILVGSYVPQDSHDIKDILFGNAVMVERSQMWVALVVSGFVLAVHFALAGPFLMVSFDHDTARSHGLPVAVLDGVLFLTLGLVASAATRTIGALPAFAFTVLPAAAALSLTRRMVTVFVLAPVLGAASAFFGYYASFQLALPTGSCMAALAGLIFVVSAAVGRLLLGEAD